MFKINITNENITNSIKKALEEFTNKYIEEQVKKFQEELFIKKAEVLTNLT